MTVEDKCALGFFCSVPSLAMTQSQKMLDLFLDSQKKKKNDFCCLGNFITFRFEGKMHLWI